jgi:hypothetical protein
MPIAQKGELILSAFIQFQAHLGNKTHNTGIPQEGKQAQA